MKSTQKCPKCEGRRFAVTKEFRQGLPFENATVPVHAIAVPRRAASPGEVSIDGVQKTGHFQTWICLGCGYTEFYAYGLVGIEELASKYPDRLSMVDATSKDGPYR